MKKLYFYMANLILITSLYLTEPAMATQTLLTDDLTNTSHINLAATSSLIDTVNHEIRQPYQLNSNSLDIKAGSLDYVVINNKDIQTYSFNGSSMALNTSLSLTNISNPIGVTTQINSTDMVIVNDVNATRYMFNGSGLNENPLLSITGLNMPVSISSRPSADDFAILDASGMNYYSSTGSGMVNNPALSITTGLINPLAVSLHPNNYDTVILDGDKSVKYYKYTGSSLQEAPTLRISGLTNPIAVTIKDNNDIVVLDNTEVKYYSFTGTDYIQNTILSKTGLIDPIALSVRPGTYDYAVLDNGEVKYYSFTGAMTYNPSLSMSGIATTKGYKTSTKVQSSYITTASAVSVLRLSATETIPAGTSITYELTSNGGITWTPTTLGVGTTITNPGTEVGWRGTLATTDKTVTPKIKPNIVLITGNPPQAINLTVIPKNAQGYVTSIIPTLGWNFFDIDVGDTQSAFQVEIYRTDTGVLVHDSGKVINSTTQYQVPYGVLGSTNNYWWRVRVWDNWDFPSPWTTNITANANFSLLALYDFSVTDIINAPPSPPYPANPPLPTMTFPIYIKAGSNFSFSVKSIGQLDQVQAVFSFGKTISMIPTNPLLSNSNVWTGTVFPPGTLPMDTKISVTITGTKLAESSQTVLNVIEFAIIKGSVYGDFIVVLTK